MRLEGKVAVVTGGSGGLGAAICEEFALEGADCLVVYRTDAEGAQRTVAAVQSHGRRAHALPVEVSDEAQVKGMLQEAEGHFGRIDIMAAVAGIGGMAPLLETTTEQLQRVLQVNVVGTYLCVRYAAAAMIRSGGGKIITMSSIHGLGGTHWASIYEASKGAIIAFTRGAAFDLAEHNIQINAIAPGAVPVPKDPPPAPESPLGRAWMQYTPLGRWGVPRDVARAAVYLASSDSDWVTGQVLSIDGGISAGHLVPSFKHYGDKPKMSE